MRTVFTRLVPAAALVVSGALALAAPAATASPVDGARATVGVRGQQLVVLPTGDQVRLVEAPGGQITTRVRPAVASGPGAALTTRRIGATSYVFPAIAAPYLGRVLDRNLFNVTALAAAATRDGRVPIRVAYTGSTPSVPGVTLTSAAGGVATGYLTAESTAQFRTALTQQWRTDSAAGWPARSTLFGATRISAAVPSTGVATPKFPMVTLRLKAIGPDGAPLPYASGIILNVDDGHKYGGFVDITDGEARLSVPKGNYSAIFDTSNYDDATGWTTYVAPTAQYAVTTADQTLTTDFRRATTTNPTVRTPRPATLQGSDLGWSRTDAVGYGAIGSSYTFGDNDQVRIAPTAKATVGGQSASYGWMLTGPGTPPSYTYDLAANADHVAATLDFAFTQQDIATIKDRFFTDGPQHAATFSRWAWFPEAAGATYGTYTSWTTPATRTSYVGAIGGRAWWAADLFANEDAWDDPGYIYNASAPITPGTTKQEDWMRGPIMAAIPARTLAPYCYACRDGESMTIAVAGGSDSTAGHSVNVYGASDGLTVSRFRLYQGADLVVDRADELGGLVDVPAGNATYKAVLDLDRRLTESTQSTRTSTELTFRSASGQGPVAGQDWTCDAGDGAGCRILPVLQARVDLPTSMTGRLPSGTSTVTVTAARIQGAAASTVTSATLEVRAPGSDWERVGLTSAGGGKYTGTIDNTALAGRSVDIRVTAADAGGSTFKETVLKAYTVAGT